ncbi:O-antigen ligase family protein [Polaribacter undariae]|uniref:O-antigen ligase family protein n=1 Tax=Polaribacter sejongensis TaxID=985043 RepID=A0AAJ1VG23_9FLAO|nr:O-antigen ligase family protein [Polaribacter undariae]MDN3619151.1 O-antigen ligase family protein [Polaribacter undariae]UWD33648.1 O-antigen ligase family protein [Polaribacter undariae]
MTTNIFGYSFFLPEICFFLLPFVAPLSIKTLNKNFSLIILTVLGVFLGYLSAINGGSEQVMNNFLAGTDFYATLLVFLFFPLKKENIKFLLKPTVFLISIISLEIILYSFGFLSYEKDLDGNANYSGFSRISTTIGAATGTAVAYFFMTLILFCLIPKKIKKIFLLSAFIVMGITLTRSVIIANIILAFFIFKRDKNIWLSKEKKFLRYIGIIAVLVGLAVTVNKLGIVDNLFTRSTGLEVSNSDISNGRFDRWESTFKVVKEFPVLGTGANYITKHKRSRYTKVDSKNLFSPHNTFLLILMERGIVGFFIFLFIIIQLVRFISWKKNRGILKIGLILSLIIFMNTEIVILFSESTGLFLILWSLIRIESEVSSVGNLKKC